MSAGGGPPREFSISLDMVGPTAFVSLKGRFDAAAVTDLAKLLDQVIANGYSSMVVDLVALDALDPSGMALIATSARRLADGGRRLSIRSPSASMQGQLQAGGLGDLIRGEEFEPMPATIGTRLEPVVLPSDLPTLERLSSAAKVSALPTDNDLVDATLRLVVTLARTTVGGADGVSVSLRRHGLLATVAASDQTVLDMDTQQYATGEGPCVDASNQGRWFHAPMLDEEDRWPDFTPRARALGIRAILSSPLMALGRPVGALNIYSRRTSAFATDDQRLALTFATEVSAILSDAGVDASDDQRSERFQASLRSREIIAQAQGVLMERDGVSEDEAFTELRVHSQQTGLSLRARAEEITGSTRRPPTEPAPRPGGGQRG